MPDMNGYEVVSQLRRDPIFAHTPILILTANIDLENKLKAFERGADDYLGKPFNPEEFQARIRVMVQHSEIAKTARTLVGVTDQVESHTIAVHSLRGGSGCSSIALNLGLGLNALWERPTLMIDGVLIAGQIALMLNESSKRTWADLIPDQAGNYDEISIQSIISKHETGLHYVASPAYPVDAEGITPKAVGFLLGWAKEQYDYIVIDVSHNFNNVALPMLDTADIILLVVSPEMASIRAAAAAINTYEQLSYPAEKIYLILNWTFQRQGLPQKQIENALKKKISLVIPFAPDIFIGAINMGKPILANKFDHPVGVVLENAAYQLSQEQHRNYPPIKPTETWKRVAQRLKKTGG
jgi:pilus assembly protein CpaE